MHDYKLILDKGTEMGMQSISLFLAEGRGLPSEIVFPLHELRLSRVTHRWTTASLKSLTS